MSWQATGKTVDELFARFDDVAIGAASIGQARAARFVNNSFCVERRAGAPRAVARRTRGRHQGEVSGDRAHFPE